MWQIDVSMPVFSEESWTLGLILMGHFHHLWLKCPQHAVLAGQKKQNKTMCLTQMAEIKVEGPKDKLQIRPSSSSKSLNRQ